MRRDITYKINNQPKFVRAITFAVKDDLRYISPQKHLEDKVFEVLNSTCVEE
jgi:hypothetical protein